MGDEFDVGARLKILRQKAGLSQRQLAERAEVPHGQISMIETGRSSPSVASLRRILGGLGITMSAFFEPDETSLAQVFFRACDLTDLTGHLGDGVAIAQVGDATAHGLQILYETYAPGADTGEAMLAHEANEGGIVVEGEIEVIVGDQRMVLGPGDAYLFDSRAPHRFRNPGPGVARIISACTPPYL
ncbi:cupin domain-containing protein [Maritimibacter sp. HL-12]|jgi:transcriptional regulator with XRE-family HTH domain|uniref:cupin domain-containing protein n=1 Tax=Maritimibacter sp. HL-12 TaxID=1162418 RepID=UPI000A0F156D|nr:cupin domain-containing protein [Maritimibacter sp. HL-12]SMH48983.1 transcriptional regulator, XRE family with cupin sensor [Maritimibacter sp. HL-12]